MKNITAEELRALFLQNLQAKLDTGKITPDEYHHKRQNIELSYSRLKNKMINGQLNLATHEN